MLVVAASDARFHAPAHELLPSSAVSFGMRLLGMRVNSSIERSSRPALRRPSLSISCYGIEPFFAVFAGKWRATSILVCTDQIQRLRIVVSAGTKVAWSPCFSLALELHPNSATIATGSDAALRIGKANTQVP